MVGRANRHTAYSLRCDGTVGKGEQSSDCPLITDSGKVALKSAGARDVRARIARSSAQGAPLANTSERRSP